MGKVQVDKGFGACVTCFFTAVTKYLPETMWRMRGFCWSINGGEGAAARGVRPVSAYDREPSTVVGAVRQRVD